MTSRKFDIVQMVIVIAGIVCVYNGVILFPQLLIFFYYWIDGGLRATGEFTNMVVYMIIFAFYFLAGMLIIKKSGSVSEYVVNHSGLHNEVRFDHTKTDILYLLFIGIGVYNLLEKVPPFLKNVFIAFADKAGRQELDKALHSTYNQNPSFAIPVMNLLLNILLLAFAKDLAIYFAGKFSALNDITDIGENEG